MSCDYAGSNVSTKNLIMEYFKLQNREDMAKAIDKHCDEECGIVFNRHPATDETKFSSIYDYSVAASEKIFLSTLTAAVTPSNSSNDSVTSDSLGTIPVKSSSDNFSRTVSKSSYNMSPKKNVSECEYTGEEVFIKNRSRQTSKQTILEKAPTTEDTTEQVHNTLERAVSDDSTDAVCDVIVPEGKGKFQKFVEDFAYILFRDGTHHYYPIHLVKYNKAYLKKHPLFALNYNYRDKALKHTQNILKANKNNLCNLDITGKTEKAISYEFVNFPEEANYLKTHLTVNDVTKCNHNENYLLHLNMQRMSEKCNGNAERFVDDPTCNPIKKNVHIKDVKNLYHLEKMSSYKMIEEEVVDENSADIFCCPVEQ